LPVSSGRSRFIRNCLRGRLRQHDLHEDLLDRQDRPKPLQEVQGCLPAQWKEFHGKLFSKTRYLDALIATSRIRLHILYKPSNKINRSNSAENN
jgi:hypothetical protein